MDNARAALALEAANAGTWKWTIATGELEWDEPLERVFGIEPGTFEGTFEAYLELVHPADRAPTMEAVQNSLAKKVDHYVEHRVLLPDGSIRWISGRGRVVLDDAGEPRGMVGIGEDITAQHLAEQRLQFLARAGDVLGSSLDLGTTLQQLCDLLIESLADWCTVDLWNDRDVELVAVAHRDPDQVQWARQLRERFGVDMESDVGLPLVLKTGQPYVLHEIDEEWLRQMLNLLPGITDEELERFMALELRSSMTVPLKSAKGAVLGAIGLVSAETGRLYTDDDLTLALEVARRAAIAVENAQLFEHTRHTYNTLQKSLLPPELPDLGFADLGVCFLPFGGPDDLLGGDFYDIVDMGNDTWGVILGDVSGKGVAAATLASASRWSFRSVITRTTDPAEALRELNDTLRTQDWDGRYVTAVVAVFHREATGGLSVHFSVGGHPNPLLRRQNGEIVALPSKGTLIGALPEGTWHSQSVSLGLGDAFVLYSDGLSETISDGGALFGENGVVSAIEKAHPSVVNAAQDLVEYLCSEATAFGGQRDDMAALVVSCRGVADGGDSA
ncbi:MAG: SpoIIE family protein phosphatase [Actinomycetes bacterium]